jgi:hypothetical protein
MKNAKNKGNAVKHFLSTNCETLSHAQNDLIFISVSLFCVADRYMQESD